MTYNRKAFTLIETLIAIAICTMVVTIGIITMVRGSSDVKRGSFKSIAANRSAFICYLIRKDISNSNPSETAEWDDNKLTIKNRKGEIKYTFEKKYFERESDSETQRYQLEYDNKINIEVKEEDPQKKRYEIEIITKENEDIADDDNKSIMKWYAVIFPPKASNEQEGVKWKSTIGDFRNEN